MSAQEVLDYLSDLMTHENLRPTQQIDTLMQAIEDDVGELEDDDEDNPDDDDELED